MTNNDEKQQLVKMTITSDDKKLLELIKNYAEYIGVYVGVIQEDDEPPTN